MTQARPIIFGEVLFDCFPDGQVVLGGAPFNVAWHLQGFSCAPLLISCVGNDDHGDAVRTTLSEKGMDISGIQISDCYPTGQVVVTLQDGQPGYDIVTKQAYDYINAQAALNALPEDTPALVYHGSLALRTESSRNALDILLQKTNAPVFLDLNLREPWWEMSLLESILQRATWVKLNDEELCEVTRRTMSDGPELQVYAKELFATCQLERLIVTRGAQGAFVLSKEGIVEGESVPVKNIIDTVGAGDAFSAVTIAGILQGWSITETLNKALKFAAKICLQQGATA
ncbi:MAG: carbohydrate kinase [Gammaproteobacteria bacterium]|nr:carbohydrate kinase [Gammaproteobacteria bacterium]MCF6258991.1 carbohydrate kinase [Gammaproteobacteria bacterium]